MSSMVCEKPIIKASKITFQVEDWATLERDGQELFRLHYDELALHKEAMPMGLDSDWYRHVEKNGYLLVLTARKDGHLIGYYVAMVFSHHPHNKGGGKVSSTDMFVIDPSHRKAGAGARLLMAAERELKRLGVVKASISTKVHFENRELLDALGWTKTDVVRQKLL